MNGLICITVLALVGAGLYQAYKWGYDRGFRDGYEDGDYEGYKCGVEDSNRQFKNMCDEAIKKKSMKTFVNKISGVKWMALDNAVVEGADSYYIKHANVSLPKSEWEEKKDERLDGR